MSRISQSADLRNQIPSTNLIASVLPVTTVVLTSATSSVNLTNLPAGGSFQVNVNTRSTAGDSKVFVFMRLNDNTGTIYDQTSLQAAINETDVSPSYNQDSFSLNYFPAGGSAEGHSGNVNISIPNCKNTTWYKNITAIGNHVTTGAESRVGMTQGVFRSTNAISSIQFFLAEGNFATGSYFAVSPAP